MRNLLASSSDPPLFFSLSNSSLVFFSFSSASYRVWQLSLKLWSLVYLSFEFMKLFFFKIYYSDLSSFNLTIEINFTRELKYEILLQGFLKHLINYGLIIYSPQSNKNFGAFFFPLLISWTHQIYFPDLCEFLHIFVQLFFFFPSSFLFLPLFFLQLP